MRVYCSSLYYASSRNCHIEILTSEGILIINESASGSDNDQSLVASLFGASITLDSYLDFKVIVQLEQT